MKILVLNLMPNKIETENQITNVLKNKNFELEFTFLRTASYKSKNTDFSYLEKNYKVFDEISNLKFDGFICTGAPVEKMRFNKVIYWDELKTIFKWVRKNSIPSYYICWGAQAALKIFYEIEKFTLNQKLSGIFDQIIMKENKILKNLKKPIFIPVSRFTGTKMQKVLKKKDLEILLYSKKTGPCLIANKKFNEYYNFNHFEYSTGTLNDEYSRDKKNNFNINIPENYYPKNNPKNKPINCWSENAIIFYNNWLNEIFFINKKL